MLLTKVPRSQRKPRQGFHHSLRLRRCRFVGLRRGPEKRAAVGGRFELQSGSKNPLLQLSGNARELAIERTADRIDRRDDHYRDAGGDQAVFNRGRTRLVLEKRKQLGHLTHSIEVAVLYATRQ